MQTMYPAIPNSPQTSLTQDITAMQTTIEVADGSKLPDAPNLVTIGDLDDENAETILYTQKNGNVLSGITRGFQGQAKAWPAGTLIARYFTAYDYHAVKQNIEEHVLNNDIHITPDERSDWNAKETPQGAQAKADQAEANAKNYTDQQIANLPDPSWDDIQNKPSSFPPSSHTHAISDITGLQQALDSKETPQGAQQKADQAETKARVYTDTVFDQLNQEINTHLAETAQNAHLAKNIGIEDAAGNFTATDVEGALAELFQSVSDGKTQLETAITDKGGTVSKSGSVATFDELDNGIRSIPVGDYAVGDTIKDSVLMLLDGGMGVEIWSKTDVANGCGITVDGVGNVYVAHNVGIGQKAVRKLDADGNEIWSKTDVPYGWGISVDDVGNVYVAHSVGIGEKAARKLDSAGNEIWSKTDVPYGWDIAVDSVGNVYVAHNVSSGGKAVRKLDSAGNEIWSKTDVANGCGITVDGVGNVYVAHNVGIGQKAVRKLDADGNEIWSKTDVADGWDIAVDSAGNVYVAYYVSGGKAVRKLDSAGNEIWSKTDVPFGYGISVDDVGNVYVAHDMVSGKAVRKLDSAGNEIWSKTDVPFGNGIAVDGLGNVYVAHYVSSGGKVVRKLDGNRYFRIVG